MIMYTEVTTERKLAELALASEKERLLKTNEALDKANARYSELDELKTKFVSVASHELRTPIMSIIGFAETLLAKDITISDQDRERYLRIIEKEGKRLGSLVQSLLDIAKIEKGGAAQNYEMFDIAELAQETINSIIIPAHLLVSVVQKTSFEPRTLAVREQIRQIIRNLLDNAIRHTTAPGGSITISIDHNQDNIIVSVKDTGTGIPENELKKIFERFHRVKGENGSKGEGSGLGLAIAKEIIEAHHGRIWVESTLGVGSTFYFTIPLKR
jgi:signal transduction histidine kinase